MLFLDYGRGLAFEELGKKELALADYEKAVAIEPKYVDALCQYGILLFLKGMKDQGCVHMQKAKSLGSEKAKEFYILKNCKGMGNSFLVKGNTKLQNNDFTGAIEDFTSGIKLNNELEELYIKRAACYKNI